MQVRVGVAAVMVAARAYAQSPSLTTSLLSSTTSLLSSTTAPPVMYTTITYDDCESISMATMITITNGVTVTYCPECPENGMPPTTSPAPGYTTVYTTTYQSLCPTGVVDATYTVTESCTDATPTWTPGPSHIPNGFTVTTKECTVCAHTPTTLTITEPCGCEATEGVPATPTPSGSSPGGSSPGGGSGPAGNSPSGSSPSSSPSQCNGQDCGGSGNQSPGSPAPAAPGGSGSAASPAAPTPSTTTNQCPGPQCRAVATGSTPAGSSPAGSTTAGSKPATYTGNAPSFSSAGILSIALTIVVGALAFTL